MLGSSFTLIYVTSSSAKSGRNSWANLFGKETLLREKTHCSVSQWLMTGYTLLLNIYIYTYVYTLQYIIINKILYIICYTYTIYSIYMYIYVYIKHITSRPCGGGRNPDIAIPNSYPWCLEARSSCGTFRRDLLHINRAKRI